MGFIESFETGRKGGIGSVLITRSREKEATKERQRISGWRMRRLELGERDVATREKHQKLLEEKHKRVTYKQPKRWKRSRVSYAS